MRSCASEPRRWLTLGIVPALVLGVAGCGGSSAAPAPAVDDEPITLASPQASGQSPVPARGDLEIEDQSGDGRQVQVQSVEMGRTPGFIVISDMGGQVLGSVPIRLGVRPVTVELTTPVTQSQELLATLYTDNGDGVLNPQSDQPALESDGEVAEEDFDYTVR